MIAELNVYLCENGNAFWAGSALGSEFCVTSGVLSSSVPLMLSGVKGDWRSPPADSFKKRKKRERVFFFKVFYFWSITQCHLNEFLVINQIAIKIWIRLKNNYFSSKQLIRKLII